MVILLCPMVLLSYVLWYAIMILEFYVLWSYCLMSYDHTVLYPMVLLSYVLWSYAIMVLEVMSHGHTVLCPMVILSYGPRILCPMVILSYVLWSCVLWSYCLMSYGHTVVCPMVLESYVLESYSLIRLIGIFGSSKLALLHVEPPRLSLKNVYKLLTSIMDLLEQLQFQKALPDIISTFTFRKLYV